MAKHKSKRQRQPKVKPPQYLALVDVQWPVKCDDTKEVCETYRDYLRSLHWYKFRVSYRRLKTVDQRCATCNTPDRLELHHLTYANIGRETPEDVMWLCSYCHDSHHNRRPSRRRYA
jgi:hypothetical protein